MAVPKKPHSLDCLVAKKVELPLEIEAEKIEMETEIVKGEAFVVSVGFGSRSTRIERAAQFD